jgi:acetylglutamate kinase
MVVKLGGSTLGSHDTTLSDLVTLQKRGIPCVVVHGGANVVTKWLDRLRMKTRFVKGLRVTDADTLEVVVAILAGLVNKQLVAAIEGHGGKAVGLCGIDGGLVEAEIKDAEMEYVGEVAKVDPAPLQAVLQAGYIPVVAPLSIEASRVPGENGFILNVNGDTVAAGIAAALGAGKLIFLTDVAGIYNDAGELINRLSRQEASELVASGVASGGMIPKIEACLLALPAVDVARIIDGKLPHALIREADGIMDGTTIAP